MNAFGGYSRIKLSFSGSAAKTSKEWSASVTHCIFTRPTLRLRNSYGFSSWPQWIAKEAGLGKAKQDCFIFTIALCHRNRVSIFVVASKWHPNHFFVLSLWVNHFLKEKTKTPAWFSSNSILAFPRSSACRLRIAAFFLRRTETSNHDISALW